MSIFDTLFSWFYSSASCSSASDNSLFDDAFSINPANGLPMCGSVDIEGNPYGCDSMSSSSEDLFSSSISSDGWD